MLKRAVVWVTRTNEGARRTARALGELGHEAIIAPVLRVTPLSPIIDAHSFDAAILTSRNGVNAFAAVCTRRALTVYCVGDATAEAAEAKKFQRVISARGDAAALHALIRDDVDKSTRLLFAGAREPASDLTLALRRDGFNVREAFVYDTHEVMPALSSFDVARLTHVLIHSPKGGHAVARVLTAQHGKFAFDKLSFICMSEAAWQGLATGGEGNGFDSLHHRISPFPDEASMLRLID